VQLSKRDQTDKAEHEKWAEQRAQELAAAAVVPKDQQISALERSLTQLELALAQKAEVRLLCRGSSVLSCTCQGTFVGVQLASMICAAAMSLRTAQQVKNPGAVCGLTFGTAS
jgi:hypothetical protein